jgi:alpha-glucosidase
MDSSSSPISMRARRERDPDWWRGAVIYQIYPRSFMDTDGDGIGDLAGITARLDYVAALGVDAIWLSPFYTSPMADFGYDISDYKDVDPMFGTLADFDALVARADELGLGVIVDLVISHTSDRHPWFAESRASRDNPKADWYVWADAKPDGTAPNNWLSIFGGPAWEWDTRRCQYYQHNFLTSQPDLNFHNADVQDAVLNVAKFWLDRGVAGFRLDTVNFYFCDKELRDNPAAPPGRRVATAVAVNPYTRQIHLYDKSRPENLAFLERLRALMDAYPGVTSVGELGTDEDLYGMTAAYTEKGRRLHMAYSFDLLTSDASAGHVRAVAAAMEAGIGDGWPSWALSNHDVARVATRWGHAADAAAFGPLGVALVTSLKGTACLYQGEELALTEAEIPFERLRDPYGVRFWPEFKGRDGCRTPMPWRSDTAAAGFSSGEPWLPVPDDHRALSVATQAGDPGSPLARARRFLAWRRGEPALKTGAIAFLDAGDADILAFRRGEGGRAIVCLFNLSGRPVTATVPAGLMPLAGHGFEATAAATPDGRVRLEGFGAWFGRG